MGLSGSIHRGYAEYEATEQLGALRFQLFHRGDGPDGCQRGNGRGVRPSDIIQHCKPLLASLNARIEARNLNYTILDVLKVTTNNGNVCSCYRDDPEGMQREITKEIRYQLCLDAK